MSGVVPGTDNPRAEALWLQATEEGWSLTDENAPEEMRLAQLSGYLQQFAHEQAASPALPEGRRRDAEDEADALENALVEYDEKGELFGTSGAGAYFLASFLVDRGWRAALPEGRADGRCECGHVASYHEQYGCVFERQYEDNTFLCSCTRYAAAPVVGEREETC